MTAYLMSKWLIVLMVIAIIGVIGLLVLYFLGNRLKKKQDHAEEQMQAAGQSATILVIDKKKMKLKDANLPKIVLDQTPKYLRITKVPVVKAKIGPQIITLICDPKVYDMIPIKKEIRAVISGIYITEVKGIRGSLVTETEKQKKKRLKKEVREKKLKESKDMLKKSKK